MWKTCLFVAALFVTMSSCIKDDFVDDLVDPVIRIMNPLDTLAQGSSYSFKASFFNAIGEREEVPVVWSSSDPSILTIGADGVAEGIQFGTVTLTVSTTFEGELVTAMRQVAVGNTTVVSELSRTGTVNTTSTYALSGDFTISQNATDLLLEFEAGYEASTALPGLYVYLSNNPNSIASAYEIGAVTVFNGAHNYTIPNTDLYDYQYVVYFCKPFNVKVGHGEILD